MHLSALTRLTVILFHQTARRYLVGGLWIRDFPISPSVGPYLALTQIRSLTIYVFRETMTRALLCSNISLSRFTERTARLEIPNVTIVGADLALLTPRHSAYNMQSIFRHLRITNVENLFNVLAYSLWEGVRTLVVSLPLGPHSEAAEAAGGSLWTPRVLEHIFSEDEPAWTFIISAHDYWEDSIAALASVAQHCSRFGVLALPQFVHPDGAIVLRAEAEDVGDAMISFESKISSLPAAERAVVKVEVVAPAGT